MISLLSRLFLKFSLVSILFVAGCVAPMPPPVSGTQNPASTAADLDSSQASATAAPARFAEATPRFLPLSGPITDPLAEISGMAWYGEWLVLMPQFPSRFGAGDGIAFLLHRAEIEALLDGTSVEPLEPRALSIEAPGVSQIPGFEGYEAVAFDGGRAYVTVEAEPQFGGPMQGWLLSGAIDEGATLLRIDAESAIALDPQARLSNMTDETLVVLGSGSESIVHTIYEANGLLVNRKPLARRFSEDLSALETVPMASTEFRITDATAVDTSDRFWAINYFFPGDLKLRPGTLAEIQLPQIEQLLEYEIGENGISRTQNPPYPILLDVVPRNWEGLVRLEGRGFLLVTDRFPTTLLAFIPLPQPKEP